MIRATPSIESCKLCGSPRVRSRYRMDASRLIILRCDACGFLFVDFVNQDYLKPVETAWDFAGHAQALAVKFRAYCDEIERTVPLAGMRLLDVGAGGGDFLRQARERGAIVLGLDLDLTGIRFAREMHDATILPQLVEETDLAPASMDVVSMWEVIEHVNDPRGTVAAVSRILAPGGWFLLSTPCLDSLWDKASFLLYDISFGLIQFPLTWRFSWAHLQIFSRTHLTRLMADYGFAVRKFDQRMEFTYPTEIYLKRIRNGVFRGLLSFLWRVLIAVVPVKNKMVVFLQKEIRT